MTIFFESGTKIDSFISFFIESLDIADNKPILKFDEESFISNNSVLILNYQ